MNSIALFIYIGSVLDGLGSIVGLFAFLSLMTTIITLAFFIGLQFESNENEIERWGKLFRKILKFSVPILVFFGSLNLFLPDTKTFYMIVGAHYGEEIVTSEKAKQLGLEGLELLEKAMEQKKNEIEEQLSEVNDDS